MRISAAEEYGLRCLIVLARQWPDQQVSIAEIAEEEGLSVPYASKLLAILRRAGVVKAVRGRGGGFALARHPKDLSLLEIITTLGGPLLDPEHCTRYTGQLDLCVHMGNCSVHEVLDGLAGYLSEVLSGTSLADIAETGQLGGGSRSGLREIARGPLFEVVAGQDNGTKLKSNRTNVKQ
ncbi:MAG: Rrf2 family transcriptional regulator [Candidatus Zixiibacteriota bacterium]